jgi:hypothetical protein
MKRVFLSLLTVSFVIGIILFNGIENQIFAAETAFKPVVTLSSHYVQMDKKAKVVIMGTGFQPGQKLVLLVTTTDGIDTDQNALINPYPKPDATGTWSTTWECGKLIGEELIKAGAYKLTVTDDDYNEIAITPVGFYEKKKEGDKDKKK